MNKVYVGLDLGSSSFHQTVLNHEGAVAVNRSYATSEANLRTAFAGLRGEIHVHLEAGELAPWAASIIAPLVKRVVCSHARDNAWIFEAVSRWLHPDNSSTPRRKQNFTP